MDVFEDLKKTEINSTVNKQPTVKKFNVIKVAKIVNKILFLWKVFKEIFIIYLLYKTLF